jgi:hypothetical protein
VLAVEAAVVTVGETTAGWFNVTKYAAAPATTTITTIATAATSLLTARRDFQFNEISPQALHLPFKSFQKTAEAQICTIGVKIGLTRDKSWLKKPTQRDLLNGC